MNTVPLLAAPKVHGSESSSLVEALLFSSGRPMSIGQIANALQTSEINAKRTIKSLRDRLEADQRGVCVLWDGTEVSLAPHQRFAATVQRVMADQGDRQLSIVREYLHVQHQRGRRPGTLESYRLFLFRFVRTVGKPIDEITTRDIRLFLMAEEQRGNSISTIASKVARLSSFFKWLEREEVIDRNPMLKIDAPKVPKTPPRDLTHDEVEQIREVAKGVDLLLFEVMYSSGARVSEVVAMDWDHIDLAGKEVEIPDGKGGKSRICPLSTKAVRLLRQHKRQRKDDDPHVFRSQYRRRMSKETITRRIRALGERAGLAKRLTSHRMRHTMATHLLAAGMPIEMVQYILGHESIRTTQVYARTQTHQIDQYYRRVFP